MADTKRHVLVCNNVDCRARGSDAVREALCARVAAGEVTNVEVTAYPCFGGCDFGPNVVIYPDKCFYSGVSEGDVPEIVAQLQGGPPVTRLTGKVDPMTEELIFELLDAGLV
ncbi:MAG: (2Fe-2S) ferredoxin domain-containing protein [Chloroflexi bacterium]|jgi:(2Fe-2S) ferredoxin|nr:(2Fe-2S) ferredoxin domain-containing protein [Chloroflexota bacterium]